MAPNIPSRKSPNKRGNTAAGSGSAPFLPGSGFWGFITSHAACDACDAGDIERHESLVISPARSHQTKSVCSENVWVLQMADFSDRNGQGTPPSLMHYWVPKHLRSQVSQRGQKLVKSPIGNGRSRGNPKMWAIVHNSQIRIAMLVIVSQLAPW